MVKITMLTIVMTNHEDQDEDDDHDDDHDDHNHGFMTMITTIMRRRRQEEYWLTAKCSARWDHPVQSPSHRWQPGAKVPEQRGCRLGEGNRV